MIVCIDNGHGSNIAGKHSPDKRLYEWEWTRKCAKALNAALQKEGIKTYMVFPEEIENRGDITKRIHRVNNIVSKNPKEKVICISIHNNATGNDGKWHTASGWSGWVAPNASANSKRLAALLWEEADKSGLKGNRAVPAGKYWVGNFGIVRDTKCPAVLTENLFMDNKQEVDFLLSDKGLQTIVDIHVNAIKKYFGL